MYYYLSLGSNIRAEESAVIMVQNLSRHFGTIGLFPFRYTLPEGVESKTRFVNTLVVIKVIKGGQSFERLSLQVKSILNSIEVSMGRNRNDPERSIKDRTADIDILGASEILEFGLFEQAREGYVRNCYFLQGEQPQLIKYGLAPHERAATVNFDAVTGQICILEDELHSFEHRFEATFLSE